MGFLRLGPFSLASTSRHSECSRIQTSDKPDEIRERHSSPGADNLVQHSQHSPRVQGDILGCDRSRLAGAIVTNAACCDLASGCGKSVGIIPCGSRQLGAVRKVLLSAKHRIDNQPWRTRPSYMSSGHERNEAFLALHLSGRQWTDSRLAEPSTSL